MLASSQNALKGKIQQGYRSYRLLKIAKMAAITMVSAALVWWGLNFLRGDTMLGNDNQKSPGYLPELNEQGESRWADADKFLPSQYFQIDPTKDTVVVSENGIVLAIPSGFAQNEDGSVINENIEITLKEALDPASIMMAGLSTRSGDKQLETGGMFYLNVTKDDKTVKINPDKAILAQIPTDSIKPGMKLFTGVRKKDGSIDWVNPKPLDKELTTVPMDQLNFYPPNYLETLKKLGLDYTNKAYADSFYYSYVFEDMMKFNLGSARFKRVKRSLDGGFIYMDKAMGDIKLGDNNIWSEEIEEYNPYESESNNVNNFLTDTALRLDSASLPINEIKYIGIDPPRIKSIWNNKFQNSFIATREFEERLKCMHEFAIGMAIDVYVNNLDKPLSTVDSLVAERVDIGNTWLHPRTAMDAHDMFIQFSRRGDGRVRVDKKLNAAIQRFYTRSREEYEEVAALAKQKWEKEQKNTEQKYLDKSMEKASKDGKRWAENLKEERDLNFEEASHQLDYKIPKVLNNPNTRWYNARITDPGWRNIDRIISEKTLTRTTINDIDPKSGKRVVIEYNPLSFTVSGSKKYERLYPYLIPDKLSSYMEIVNTKGVFKEKLNGLISYNLVCIGFANNEWYMYQQEEVKHGDLGEISLQKTEAKQMERLLKKQNRLGKVQQVMDNISDEYMLMNFEKKLKKFRATRKLQRKVAEKIFWWSGSAPGTATADSTSHL